MFWVKSVEISRYCYLPAFFVGNDKQLEVGWLNGNIQLNEVLIVIQTPLSAAWHVRWIMSFVGQKRTVFFIQQIANVSICQIFVQMRYNCLATFHRLNCAI